MQDLTYANRTVEFQQQIMFIKEIIVNLLGWRLVRINRVPYPSLANGGDHFSSSNNATDSQLTDLLKASTSKV